MAANEVRISEVPSGLVVSSESVDKTAVTEAAGFVAAQSAGEWGMGSYTGARPAPTHDEIAQLAYCFYESRAHQDGYAMEDWLRAEQQLIHHYA
jgi:hypothetical protein